MDMLKRGLALHLQAAGLRSPHGRAVRRAGRGRASSRRRWRSSSCSAARRASTSRAPRIPTSCCGSRSTSSSRTRSSARSSASSSTAGIAAGCCSSRTGSAARGRSCSIALVGIDRHRRRSAVPGVPADPRVDPHRAGDEGRGAAGDAGGETRSSRATRSRSSAARCSSSAAPVLALIAADGHLDRAHRPRRCARLRRRRGCPLCDPAGRRSRRARRPSVGQSSARGRAQHRRRASARSPERPQAAASITTYFWLRLLWSFTIVGIGFVATGAARRRRSPGPGLVTGGAGALGAALGFLLAREADGARRAAPRSSCSARPTVAGVPVVAVLGPVRDEARARRCSRSSSASVSSWRRSRSTRWCRSRSGDDFRGRAFSLYDIAYNLAWVVAAVAMKIAWDGDIDGPLDLGDGLRVPGRPGGAGGLVPPRPACLRQDRRGRVRFAELVSATCATSSRGRVVIGSWWSPVVVAGAVLVPAPRTDEEPSPRSTRRPAGCRVEWLERTQQGYFEPRSGQISLLPETPAYMASGGGGWSHSGPWPYLQRIPLVFYGPGYIEPTGGRRPSRDASPTSHRRSRP